LGAVQVDLSLEELTTKAQNQYNRQRYTESLVSAKAAVEIDEDCVNGWWFAALCHIALGDNDNALEAIEFVVDLAPHFADGWAQYGVILQSMGSEEAKDLFERAIDEDPTHVGALTALANIYRDNDDEKEDEKEISILTQLEKEEGLTSNQLNRIGILCYRNNIFFEAIKFWRKNAGLHSSSSSLFNLGLAYNHPEVSQDADAIDIWRLTKKRYPSYPNNDRLEERINTVLPPLLKLKEKVSMSGETLLNQNQWYQYYINPFELIDFPIPDGRIKSSAIINIKTIQKLKKKLLQEIELEDGNVSWVDGLQIDRSKAIGLCDDLYDERKRNYHWQIYISTSLLGFLSRGEHRHFVVDEVWSPLEIIEFLEDHDNDFREWLSDDFTKQFDLVLSTAIEKEDLAVLEALLDGRRWIDPKYTDKCFEGARKRIDQMLEKLRIARKLSKTIKPKADEINLLLNKNSLLQMLNLFPTFFWNLQHEAVGIVRDIAVNCYNNHMESDLSKEILTLSKKFKFKSAESNKQLQSDFEAIEKIIREERKAEAFLRQGDIKWEITKEGIRKGTFFIPSEFVISVRWGALISGDHYSPSHDFLFVFNDARGGQIKFQWRVSENLEKHETFYKQFIDAMFCYIFPGVMEKLEAKLRNGNTVKIGHCSITSNGIEFERKGWVLSKTALIPWPHVELSVDNGALLITDLSTKKIRTSLSMRDVDNAIAIQFLQKQMT
jgi:tetratricopeptide (TPR) repeat protein